MIFLRSRSCLVHWHPGACCTVVSRHVPCLDIQCQFQHRITISLSFGFYHIVDSFKCIYLIEPDAWLGHAPLTSKDQAQAQDKRPNGRTSIPASILSIIPNYYLMRLDAVTTSDHRKTQLSKFLRSPLS